MSNTDKQFVTITINDKEIEAVPGSMLIDVADKSDIHIPRFCYHKKLSVAANCRMCLVDVEKAPKPLPACATPVNEGMVVWTKSERALTAQKDTMEFLLINHPLDCPICDQGGECELQDLSMEFGSGTSNFHEMKRVVVDKDIGELVATEMTRCIQCTRCVRFGEEIAGMREMGATGRGDRMEIGTFVEKSLNSEISGNIIDICPVGALTAKPSRYHSRAWEMMQTPSIASHDCVGSNVKLHTFKKKLVRVIAAENEDINECWISDRDRFSYQGVYADDRVEKPMIKYNGIWKEVDWSTALDRTVEKLTEVSAKDIAVLASARATLEELYLLQKSMRSIGVANIDHRLRQVDFNDQESSGAYPSLGMKIADIENLDSILLVGSNVRKEQPMINQRIRKAALNGAKIMCVNPLELDFNYDVDAQRVSNPVEMIKTLAIIAKASYTLSKTEIPAGLNDLFTAVRVNKADKAFAENLIASKNSAVFLGSISMQHPGYSTLRALSKAIAGNTGSTLAYLSGASNSAGAWLAGVVPHQKEAGQKADIIGKNAGEMLSKTKKVYMLLDLELERDSDNPQQAKAAMNQADTIIAVTPYANKTLLSLADIILPSAAYAETSGTYVNAEGTWQSFKAAAKSYGEARPAWKILRVLGNKLDVKGFDYVSSKDVRNELQGLCENVNNENPVSVEGIYTKLDDVTSQSLYRIGNVGEFSGDSLVRRATALQKSSPEQNAVQLNAKQAALLGLKDLPTVDNEHAENEIMVDVKQGEVVVSMPLLINDNIPDKCALLASGTKSSSLLGSAFGEIEITA
ncbi:NADH-quinone oxidoreductase subunit NuoG [Cocleimonas sp. KMM 6892]|uniref:NADH-quinone oxidoreductase subunit NuoG n=1 Tax=unclassified Cocleimonas TaxID=2639732 RepID=UPI002DB915B9|nr:MULTISPECIES: NADH-quinone oxidoreductase subunit NuoG [unclassified Cocleimonas]MEB8430663.1 NADH-quinone oxidoreductase subunit NuoG [Cocleimonas sp. KMM 6892]MEC4716886.1 NADH-quinone oxidoreductase subunit NuoG [Cocleimonas sp. KMM 6895]MEC4743898.1 NADH-quinone oxidoreductase subunit NuoG [Cocleimonas sp. KMM 6896]